MLQEEVRDAVKAKKLNIFPIRHISEAFEIVTGVPLGMTNILDDNFPEESAFGIIRKKLDKMHAEGSEEEVAEDMEEAPSRKAARPRMARQRMKTR